MRDDRGSLQGNKGHSV